MISNSEAVTAGAVLDRIDAAVNELLALSFDTMNTTQRLDVLRRIETVARRLPVPGHDLINQLGREASTIELGGSLRTALTEQLHIRRADARRRIAEAEDLGRRRALTGEPLPALLEGTAAAQRAGAIGPDHIAVIRSFCRRLPSCIGAPARAGAELDLAGYAAEFEPDHTAALAGALSDLLNPDGTFTDNDQARARGLSLGKQGRDGMSKLTGWLTPEARATLEAVLAKLAAPGMCNSESEAPVVDGTPSQQAIDSDYRSAAQRHHDGLNVALRALLASGELGRHNGLPASIVVTTTLADLEAAAGRGLTAGGSLLPMSDVIRLARHAHHYLAVFDNGKALALYHTKRLASPAQRLVLYARDRGCTRPGCTASGYYCEVHHAAEDYATSGVTDVNELALACPPDHHLNTPGGWRTRKPPDGDTEWIPPPYLDRGQPRVNRYHHPEKLLRHNRADDGP